MTAHIFEPSIKIDNEQCSQNTPTHTHIYTPTHTPTQLRVCFRNLDTGIVYCKMQVNCKHLECMDCECIVIDLGIGKNDHIR